MLLAHHALSPHGHAPPKPQTYSMQGRCTSSVYYLLLGDAQVIKSEHDGKVFDDMDAQLVLNRGTPR